MHPLCDPQTTVARFTAICFQVNLAESGGVIPEYGTRRLHSSGRLTQSDKDLDSLHLKAWIAHIWADVFCWVNWHENVIVCHIKN